MCRFLCLYFTIHLWAGLAGGQNLPRPLLRCVRSTFVLCRQAQDGKVSVGCTTVYNEMREFPMPRFCLCLSSPVKPSRFTRARVCTMFGWIIARYTVVYAVGAQGWTFSSLAAYTLVTYHLPTRHAGGFFLVFSATSAGMFVSAPALLPSSSAMLLFMLVMALWMEERFVLAVRYASREVMIRAFP